jgi:hypothetical protein
VLVVAWHTLAVQSNCPSLDRRSVNEPEKTRTAAVGVVVIVVTVVDTVAYEHREDEDVAFAVSAAM